MKDRGSTLVNNWVTCFCMVKASRLFVIMLIAAFMAGMLAHTANAAAADMKMSPGSMSAKDMRDCQDCASDDDSGAVCSIACVPPLLATLASVAVGKPAPAAGDDEPVTRQSAGRTGPPEPHPPQTVTAR